MHVTALYTFDNDADITNATLSLAAALFDRVICLDFGSVDGTRAILDDFCSQNQKVELFAAPKELRRKIPFAVNSIAKFLSRTSTDWVFSFAAMEFPKIENREHLEQILARCNNAWLGMRAVFPVPAYYGEFDDFDFHQNFKWSGGLGEALVVACSSSYLLDCGSDKSPLRSAPPNPAKHASEFYAFDVPLLMCLPVRSSSRLSFHVSDNHCVLDIFGRHNTFDICAVDPREFNDPTVLNGILVRVLDRRSDFRPIELAQVALLPIRLPEGAQSNSKTSRTLSHCEAASLLKRDLPPIPSPNLMENPMTLDAAQYGYSLCNGKVDVFLHALRGDGFIREFPFATLPAGAPNLSGRNKIDLINKLIIAATTPVDAMPFSAWYTLAPVLFCLFELFQPRRYVELGSHCGYSFFAACQGAELAGSKTECIAVDSWQGDPHASHYGSEVYSSVRDYLFMKYPAQYTLKAYFSDALSSFHDRSIDLLHIDGFHTYQAVKNDFEGWLPKMSERGIIIFHDTNVYERDFGVYILWHDVRARYPSFEFRHSHGLGVLFVGSDNEVRDIFSLISSSEDYRVVLQNLMLRVAELNILNSRAIIASKEQATSHTSQSAQDPAPTISVSDQVDHTHPETIDLPNRLDQDRLRARQLAQYRLKFLLTYLSPRHRRHYRKKLRALRIGTT